MTKTKPITTEDYLRAQGINVNERGELITLPRNNSALLISNEKEGKGSSLLKGVLVIALLAGLYLFFGWIPAIMALIAVVITML